MRSGMRRGLVAWSLALACAGAANAQNPAARPEEPISLDVRDADVRDLLNALASNHNLNVVYGPHTEAAISIHLAPTSLTLLILYRALAGRCSDSSAASLSAASVSSLPRTCR